MVSETKLEFSSQFGVACVCVESPDFMNADALIAMCIQVGAILNSGDGDEFCVELRSDVGPELWTEASLRGSVGKGLRE